MVLEEFKSDYRKNESFPIDPAKMATFEYSRTFARYYTFQKEHYPLTFIKFIHELIVLEELKGDNRKEEPLPIDLVKMAIFVETRVLLLTTY